jgi:hypothetical protein
MPTGTYIQARLREFTGVNVMEVDIFPSNLDKNKSEGLCSSLGSHKLIKQDGTEEPYSKNPNQFSLSWRYLKYTILKNSDFLLHKSNSFNAY